MKQNGKINSVEKALVVLMAFCGEKSSWGVRELSAHLGFSPSTVQRILRTLKKYGFVRQNPSTKKYAPGNIYFSFLRSLQDEYPVTRLSIPYMKQLLSGTRETVHLNVIDTDGLSRICINSLESSRELKASQAIGTRAPLYAGATSKCLLSFSTEKFIENYMENIKFSPLTGNTIVKKDKLLNELTMIKKQGYASSMAETTHGLGALSVPVFTFSNGKSLLAAISLAIPEIRFNDDKHRRMCIEQLLLVSKKFSKITA